MTTFNIIENHDLFDDFPYEALKKDYMNIDIPVMSIKEKYGVTNSRKWTRILDKLRSENVPMRFKAGHDPRYYYYAKDCKKYVVRRVINKKLICFGGYSTEEEAKARVQELKANGWQK